MGVKEKGPSQVLQEPRCEHTRDQQNLLHQGLPEEAIP